MDITSRRGTKLTLLDMAPTFIGESPGSAVFESAAEGQRQGVLGYIPGAWDMLHIGHLNAFRFARTRCDYLIAGVVADEELVRIKGRGPIVPLAERLEIVRAIGIVDEAVADYSTNKLLAWKSLHFDVLFKGDDWRGTEKGIALESAMAEVGVELTFFPYTQSTSSTLRRKELAHYV